MLTFSLVLLIVLLASLHIWAEYRGPRQHVYLFKLLTMVLIGLIALLGQATSPFYKSMIIAGLVFSLAGDVQELYQIQRRAGWLEAFIQMDPPRLAHPHPNAFERGAALHFLQHRYYEHVI